MIDDIIILIAGLLLGMLLRDPSPSLRGRSPQRNRRDWKRHSKLSKDDRQFAMARLPGAKSLIWIKFFGLSNDILEIQAGKDQAPEHYFVEDIEYFKVK
jgi:hypothetical protein